MNHDLDTDLYQIAVKAGVLKESYSPNQFDCCPERLLTDDNINQDKFHSEKLLTSSQCMGDKGSRSVVVLQCNVKVTDVHVTRQKCCITVAVMVV